MNKRLAEKLVEAIMNKDKGKAQQALAAMVNTRLAGKIVRVRKTEPLI